MTEPSDQKPADTAVWYFVGAVFILVAPLLFFPGIELWARLLITVAGLVVMGVGFVQLRKELARKKG